MRTIIDIPQPQIQQLAGICASMNVSRAEIIRQAIANYIEHLGNQAKQEEEEKRKKKKAAIDAAFGIWADRNIDSVEYVRKLRSEWDREWDSVKGEWIYKDEQ